VQYTVGDWLLKNSDPLPESMPQVFATGGVGLIRKMFEAKLAAAASAAEDTAGGGGKAKKAASSTVSMSFVKSMKALTEELSMTKCNFIRCIKPNAQMRAGVFNRCAARRRFDRRRLF